MRKVDWNFEKTCRLSLLLMLLSTYPPIYITLAPGELKLKLRDSNLELQGCLGNFDQPLNRGGLFEVAICFIRQIFLHHLNPLLPAIKRCCYIYMRAFLSPSINVPIGLYDRLPSLPLSSLSQCHPFHSLGHYLQSSPLSHTHTHLLSHSIHEFCQGKFSSDASWDWARFFEDL